MTSGYEGETRRFGTVEELEIAYGADAYVADKTDGDVLMWNAKTGFYDAWSWTDEAPLERYLVIQSHIAQAGVNTTRLQPL